MVVKNVESFFFCLGVNKTLRPLVCFWFLFKLSLSSPLACFPDTPNEIVTLSLGQYVHSNELNWNLQRMVVSAISLHY